MTETHLDSGVTHWPLLVIATKKDLPLEFAMRVANAVVDLLMLEELVINVVLATLIFPNASLATAINREAMEYPATTKESAFVITILMENTVTYAETISTIFPFVKVLK